MTFEQENRTIADREWAEFAAHHPEARQGCRPSDMHDPLGGWLAPDGTFYPCPDSLHWQQADYLAESLQLPPAVDSKGRPWPTSLESTERLLRAGWVTISTSSDKLNEAVCPMRVERQPQLDAIFDLAIRFPGTRLSALLMETLDNSRV